MALALPDDTGTGIARGAAPGGYVPPPSYLPPPPPKPVNPAVPEWTFTPLPPPLYVPPPAPSNGGSACPLGNGSCRPAPGYPLPAPAPMPAPGGGGGVIVHREGLPPWLLELYLGIPLWVWILAGVLLLVILK